MTESQRRAIHTPLRKRNAVARANWYRELSRVGRNNGEIIGTFGMYGLRLVPRGTFAQIIQEQHERVAA